MLKPISLLSNDKKEIELALNRLVRELSASQQDYLKEILALKSKVERLESLSRNV